MSMHVIVIQTVAPLDRYVKVHMNWSGYRSIQDGRADVVFSIEEDGHATFRSSSVHPPETAIPEACYTAAKKRAESDFCKLVPPTP